MCHRDFRDRELVLGVPKTTELVIKQKQGRESAPGPGLCPPHRPATAPASCPFKQWVLRAQYCGSDTDL